MGNLLLLKEIHLLENFLNALLEGFGKYILDDSDYYNGEFKIGIMKGLGTSFFPDDKKFFWGFLL